MTVMSKTACELVYWLAKVSFESCQKWRSTEWHTFSK